MTQHAPDESPSSLPRPNRRETARAAALRENLRKRKMQQQARDTHTDKPSKE